MALGTLGYNWPSATPCLASVRLVLDQEQILRYVVWTPHCYLYEMETNNQVLECLLDAINLKKYALKYLISPTTERSGRESEMQWGRVGPILHTKALSPACSQAHCTWYSGIDI